MQHHDGNILAGPLADVFAADVTTARARCTGCGAVAELAAAMVYDSAMGDVVRCRDCGTVLLTFVEAGDRLFVNFIGVGAIELARP
jgi:ribosomal protein S27E